MYLRESRSVIHGTCGPHGVVAGGSIGTRVLLQTELETCVDEIVNYIRNTRHMFQIL